MKTPHIERMEGELATLSDRSEKLAEFVNENPLFAGLASIDQGLMAQQLAAMRQYECVLSMRLRRASSDGDSGGTPPPPPPPAP